MDNENIRAMYPWAKKLDADPQLKAKLVESMLALIPGDEGLREKLHGTIDSTLKEIIEEGGKYRFRLHCDECGTNYAVNHEVWLSPESVDGAYVKIDFRCCGCGVEMSFSPTAKRSTNVMCPSCDHVVHAALLP